MWAMLAHGFHGPLLKCLYDEARKYGERAQQIAMSFPSDQYLYFKSLAGLGYLHWSVGELKETHETAGLLLEYGERTSNSRSNVLGNFFFAMCQMVDVDMDSAKKKIPTGY